MTNEITSQILQQVRADIAEAREHTDHRFDQVDDQLRAIVVLMGQLARTDEDHEQRIRTLERRDP